MLTTDGRISSAQALLAIRDPRIRKYRATHVWLAVFASLTDHTPAPLKVRRTAKYLRLRNRIRVRKALQLLVDTQYLIRAKDATKGTPAEYMLGPAAFGSGGPSRAVPLRPPTGELTAPVETSDSLSLFSPAA